MSFAGFGLGRLRVSNDNKEKKFKISKDDFWKQKLKGNATRAKNRKKRKRKSN